jgi:transposase
MWTMKNRDDRDRLRYPSALTDGVWQPVKPLIPSAMRGGVKRADMREAANCTMRAVSPAM